MKKRSAILTLFVISILMISSVSLVSANVLTDIWNKITGRVTENETETTNETEPRPCPSIIGWRIENNKCVSDSGCDYDSSEYTYYNSLEECEEQLEPEAQCGEGIADCASERREYCQNLGACFSEINYNCVDGKCVAAETSTGGCISCPYGCKDGKCLTEPGPGCTSDANCLSEETMYCEGSNACTRTTEVKCIEGKCVTVGGGGGCTPCEYGCENGACLSEPGPGPEPRPDVCAAKISINFDKNVYYIGDEFKVEIGIFDSQGNPLPNYPFYIQAYNYESGTWKEIGQDRTDRSGYKIHQDKIRDGEGLRIGKNKIRIITKISECDSVEDTAIIEIKRKKATDPVPCGMGNCVPEPDPIDVEPINISDGGGFYSCTGCEADEKCYPVGYRKSGQYCDIDKEFINQMDGECDNNFECTSNLCISGECLTEGFIEKIIEWLKKIIGIKPEPPIEKACSKLLLEHSIGEYKYEKSMHGEDEHTQAPLFSEDGKHLDTIECCAAMYKDKEDTEHGVLFCPYDSKEDVTNSVKWIIAKERNIVFKEYEDEKVFGDDKGQLIAWTNNAYLIAVGVGPEEKNVPLPDDIANAYLKKYPSEFELTEDDIPDAPPGRPWVYCTEEDEKKGEKCVSQAGAQLQTDPNPEDKSCEIYKGCILPYEKCEDIDDIKEKEDCYVGVAEMTGDSSVCKEITSDESRRNKCYVKAAETSRDASICEKITEEDIKNMCFELAEEIAPWVTCKSEEDISKEECHFIDDFESGLGNWVFSSAGAGSEVVENGNTVLRLVGVERANVHRIWDNYLFKFRFKMIDGSVHVDFRRSEGHAFGAKRYLVGVNYVGVYNLNKQIGENWRELEDIDFRLDDNWHDFEIRGYDDIINVYVDNELVAKHKDTMNTLLSGWVRFEAHTGGVPGMIPELLIDDVEVKLITEEDIIYP